MPEEPPGSLGPQPGDGLPGGERLSPAVAQPEKTELFQTLTAEVAQARKDYAGGALDSVQDHLAKARTLLEELFESVAADSLLARGDALRLAEQYRDALPLLEQAVEQDPSSEALASMAATLGGLGEYESALEASEAAVERDPDASFPRVVRGALLSDKGEVDEGLRELQHAAELDPKLPATHQALARVLVKLGRIEEAVDELDLALAHDPWDGPTLLLMGQCLAALGRYPEAARVLRRMLAVDSENPVALGTMGRVLAESGDAGDAEEAVSFLTRALTAKPDLSWAHAALGACLVHTGETAAGLEHLDEAIRLDPHDANALLAKGELLWNEGMPPEAIEALRSAVEADPELVRAHVLLAEVLGGTESLDDALAAVDEALRLDPGSADAYAVKGQLLSRHGAGLWSVDASAAARRDEQAAFVLQQAIELDGDGRLPWTRGERGAALTRLGRSEEAVAQLDDGLQLETDAATRAWMLANKGSALYGLHRHHEALHSLDEADPGFVDTLFVLAKKAEIYSDMAEFEAALALLDEAIDEAAARGLEADWIFALQGWCLSSLKDGEETAARSKEAYERADRLRRGDPWNLKGIANAEFALGERAEAAEKYRQIIREQREREDVDNATLTLVG